MLELADAVIVGGGVMGAALAAALGRRLSRVLLLESERCGAKATGGGFSWVNASSKCSHEIYHRLNADACRYHITLATEWGSDRTGWHGGGTLFWSDQGLEAAANLRERAAALQSWGFPLAVVTRSEMEALEPHLSFSADAFGLFAPSEGWVETARLIRFLIEQSREARVEISEFTRVTGFTRDHTGGIATVETTRGRVSTGVVIIAAGLETAALASMASGKAGGKPGFKMQQVPGFLLETEPHSNAPAIHRVCYPPDEAGLHLRPTPQGGLLIGADDTDALCQRTEGDISNSGLASLEDDQSSTDMRRSEARLMERVSRLIPGVQNTHAIIRRCVRPIPPDGLPIVGPLPTVRGVYLLTSHSGITLGPFLAQILADEILTGRQSPRLASFRPARFPI